MFHDILTATCIISFSNLFFYYTFFFSRLNKYRKEGKLFQDPVSIIICAKNEAQNINNNLISILEQEYSLFEVIVVNDQSTDNSKILLKELANNYKNLVVVNIEDNVKTRLGKKFALTLGIKTAKYENLLLTDADCKPNSKYWIKNITANFNNSDIILGYSPYEKKKGLLNKIIRFDTFNVAQQYLSYSLANQTYMGVGRNLAYKKSIFFSNKGFANHMHLPSGDDDLFIQEVAKKDNVSIEIEKESHINSEVITSWRNWIYQKRRHITTSKLYKQKYKILLFIYPFSQLIFWLTSILILSLNFNINIIITLIFLKLLVSYIINYKTMKKLSVNDLYLLHPLYEILLILIQLFFVLLNSMNEPKKWHR